MVYTQVDNGELIFFGTSLYDVVHFYKFRSAKSGKLEGAGSSTIKEKGFITQKCLGNKHTLTYLNDFSLFSNSEGGSQL